MHPVGGGGGGSRDDDRPLPRRSLFARPIEEMEPMLRAHLLWADNDACEFVSWSSSVLWVLEHAARMRNHQRRRDVRVAVLDVRKVQDVAIFPAPTLMEVYGVMGATDGLMPRLDPGAYTAEYLFFGALRDGPGEGRHEVVGWGEILEADVFDCLRHFSKRSGKDYRLNKRVRLLRAEYDKEQGISDHALSTAVFVAALFGPEWRYVVAAALVSLFSGGNLSEAMEPRRSLHRLGIPLPREMESIVRFDSIAHVDGKLTEVRRMYEYLTLTLEGHSVESQEVCGE